MAASGGRPREVEVVVRRLVPTDLDEFRRIRLRSLQHDPLAFGSTYAREAAFEESTWVSRVGQGATGADSGTWVAEGPDGQLVGLVGVFSDAGTFVAVMMWVEPAFRGRGLGSRLLDELLAWTANARPDWSVRLSVNPRQRAAAHLYESRGFVPTGRREDLEHTPGAWADEMILRRPASALGVGPPHA